MPELHLPAHIKAILGREGATASNADDSAVKDDTEDLAQEVSNGP